MIGLFKPKNKKCYKHVSPPINDRNVAFYHFLTDNGSLIHTMEINNQDYYQVFREYISSQQETESVIYNMILELEAIELHKLTKIIEQNNGYILDLSTDSVSCVFLKKEFPFNIDVQPDGKQYINGFYYDTENSLHRYKLEDKDRLKIERLAKFIRTNTFENTETKFNIIEDVSDNNFKPLVDHILNNNISIHIDGAGGTGKSTLIKQLQAEMTKRELNFIALAPTNKASRIINGKTIHKFMHQCSGKVSRGSNYDYIIIDEISMVSERFYNFLLV
jgi:hypothetical protein